MDPQIAVSQDNIANVVWTNNATGNEEILFKNEFSSNTGYINPNFGNKSDNRDVTNDAKALKTVNIAIAQATFTEAAYDKSFYKFYEVYNLRKIRRICHQIQPSIPTYYQASLIKTLQDGQRLIK